MRKYNVMVAITPYHFFVLKNMILQRLIDSDAHNILVTTMSREELDFEGVEFFFDQEICLDIKKNGIELYFNKNVKDKINKTIHNLETVLYNKEIYLIMPHLEHPLCNALYFSLKAIKNSNFNYATYPEGIASIVPLKKSIKYLCFESVKAFLSNFGGLEYSFHGSSDDALGIFEANIIYTFNPKTIKKYIKKDTKLISMKTLSKKVKPKDKILILGQPYDKKSISDMILWSKGINTDIYYKPHPRENIKNIIYYKEILGVKILKTNLCIEEYFDKVGAFKNVISVNSSALINLKMMYGDVINCISYNAKNHIQENRREELLKIYEGVGVTVFNG